MAANLDRVNAAGTLVVKQFSFFLSYLLVVYFIVSVIRSRRDLDRMLRLLVAGGTIVAAAALFEWRTTTNLFNWYQHVVPFLHYVDEGVAQARGTGVRARASAQHPIALSAALVMLLPMALYLWFREGRKLWLGCATLLTLGALSTGSRTGTTMLIAVLVGYLCIKPRDTIRLLPWLVPLLVVVQVVLPGTIGTMRTILDPHYVIKEQSYNQGETAGRVADLGPALKRWSAKPLLGNGFGTTIADPNAKAGSEQQILLWLFCRAIRRLSARARSDPGADSWLAASLAVGLIAFVVGMLTFDAFAFIQVTFFAFVTLGFAGVVLNRPAIRVARPPADGTAPQPYSAAA
jgi:polysaccharide biosynthesis protein PslJ